MSAEPRRVYRSLRRTEQAQMTRRRVIAAARASFEVHGYAGATMRIIARESGVSTGTVELLFGRKVAVLKAAIDVAIAGDDEPVPMLERPWVQRAAAAPNVELLLAIFAGQLRESLHRSARLVHAVFEAAVAEPELAELVDQLSDNRRVVATWLVDTIRQRAPLREALTHTDAVDSVWLLMEPTAYLRLAQHRGWTERKYAQWFAVTVRHTLITD